MSKIVIGGMMGIILSGLIMGLGKLLGPREKGDHNTPTFESGFVPMSSSRERVEVRFFLIGLLFVIFDIEVALIVPYGLIVGGVGEATVSSFWGVGIFLIILTIGLIYEWQKGALVWE